MFALFKHKILLSYNLHNRNTKINKDIIYNKNNTTNKEN